MGTNYYWNSTGEAQCPHCGHERERLHIGKSSSGWCFSLRIHDYEGIKTLADWQAKWASGGTISDEYGRDVTIEEMVAIITKRHHPGDPAKRDEYLRIQRHGATAGPNGLMRHGPPAVAGDGTWDLCDYDFS